MQSIIQLLESSKMEIQALREQNTIMHARLQMFDDCMTLFQSRQQGLGMMHAPDVVRDIDNYIYEFKNPVVKPSPEYNHEGGNWRVPINADRYQEQGNCDNTNSGNGSGATDEGFPEQFPVVDVLNLSKPEDHE